VSTAALQRQFDGLGVGHVNILGMDSAFIVRAAASYVRRPSEAPAARCIEGRHEPIAERLA